MKIKKVICLISMIVFIGFTVRGKASQNICPKRIISLGSFLTEGLFLLGVQDRIVGVTTYCNRPAEAQRKEKAGSIVAVNMEKVISLRPDLVLTTPLTNAKAKNKLQKIGINIIDFEQVKDFSQVCDQFLKLGSIVGQEEKAEEIVNRARKTVRDLQSGISDKSRKKVFIQVGTKPLFTMNKEFFINDLIKLAGGINIAEDAPTGIYSREKVVAINPDVIIIASMGMTADEEKKIWNRYKTINAVRNKKIYCIDPNVICNPIPDNFVKTL